MSGIFGIVKFNEEAVLREELIQMQNAMKTTCSTANNIKCIGSGGFGHMQISSSFETQYENLPIISPCGNYLFTAYARLDNRDELGNKLGLSFKEIETVSDTNLVLRSYLKWNKDCVQHLLGDWIFAVYNIKEKQLFLAKDQGGNTGIYFSSNHNYFCFSTSVKGLLSLNWISQKIDKATVIALLVAGRRHKPDQTIFKYIFNVKPAHFLKVNKGDVQKQTRYWDIRDIKPINYNKEEEYIEHFISLYQDAITSRIRTKGEIGIMLSGGLDSSSIAALAAPKLYEQGKKLYSFTSVPMHHDHFEDKYPFTTDESAYVQHIADYIGNIHTTFTKASSYNPLSSMENSLNQMGHLVNMVYNSYWIQDVFDLAKKRGITRMLTGQLGNYTISWESTDYILKDLLQGKINSTYHEILNWSNYNDIKHYEAFKKLVLLPFKQRMKGCLKKFRPVHKSSLFNNTILNTDILKEIDIFKELNELDYIPGYTIEKDPERLRQRLYTSQISEIGLVYNQYRLENGIECVDPTQDFRIAEYTFGLPKKLWVSKGSNRYLIRKAMEGQIPNEILDNKYKNPQAADIGMRMVNLPEIEPIVSMVNTNPEIQQYIDVKKLSFHLKELNSDKSILKKRRNAYSILNALIISLFLVNREQL